MHRWPRCWRSHMHASMRAIRVPPHHTGICRTCCTGATAGELKTYLIGQGGRLSVRLPSATAVVRVSTEWTDECHIILSTLPAAVSGTWNDSGSRTYDSELEGAEKLECCRLTGKRLRVDVDEADQHVIVTAVTAVDDDVRQEKVYFVEAVVPEMCSVDVSAACGRVAISKKLKGCCLVRLGKGDISVGVVRGERTDFSTGSGRVVAKELEGNVNITATQVDVKLINGAQVQIDATGGGSSVTVGGLYSPAAQIRSTGKVDVSSCHGRVDVSTTGASGPVSLASVNGAAQVSTGGGDVNVHLEALEKGTCSNIRSYTGNIVVSMSQKVNTRVDLVGQISTVPSIFEGDVQPRRASGQIVVHEVGMSRRAGIGGGKIDLTGAREQSLSNFFGKDVKKAVLPQLKVTTGRGTIGLEMVSWIDNITRRFQAAKRVPHSGRPSRH